MNFFNSWQSPGRITWWCCLDVCCHCKRPGRYFPGVCEGKSPFCSQRLWFRKKTVEGENSITLEDGEQHPGLRETRGKIPFLVSADDKDNQTHTKTTHTVHDKDKWYNVKSQTMEVFWKLVFPESWWTDWKMWRKSRKASKEGKGDFTTWILAQKLYFLGEISRIATDRNALATFWFSTQHCWNVWFLMVLLYTRYNPKNFALTLILPVALP